MLCEGTSMTSFQIKIYSTQVLSSTDRGSRHMDHDIIMSCREVAVKDQVKTPSIRCMCLDHYLVGKYLSLHQKGDFVRLKLFCPKLKETRIQRKNCFSPLITTRYLHTIVVFFSTRSLNLTHPCTHKQSNNVCLEWAYRRIVW